MKGNRVKALPRGKMIGHNIKVNDGPWAGKTVFIPVGGTMVFRVGPWHGCYRHNGAWQDVG